MMTRRGMLGVLAGGAAALLAGCGLSGNPSYRFKMTVEVDTPAGVRRGFSVMEIMAGNKPQLMAEEKSKRSSLKGEAVAVDIFLDQTLFVLLKERQGGDSLIFAVTQALYGSEQRIKPDEFVAAVGGVSSLIGKTSELPLKDYPMMVSFRDIDDPKSVEQVNPLDLAAHFGLGVALKRITVEVTKDAMTSGIERRLTWLKTHIGMLVRRENKMPIGEMLPEHRLIVTDFKIGPPK